MLNDVKLILVVLIAASLGFGQTARKIAPSKTVKPSTIVRATPKPSPAKAAPIRATAIRKTAYRAQPAKANRVSATRSRRTAYRAPVRASYVQSPSSERYREIQQALADKGYYTAEVNGSWDSASIEALNRFKTDQKLRADGKLCSLSLIALGLGPKYEAVNVEQPSPASVSADQR